MAKTIEFTCDCCNGTFLKTESNEQDAIEEFERDFQEEDINDAAEVCDDCYKKIMSSNYLEGFVSDE